MLSQASLLGTARKKSNGWFFFFLLFSPVDLSVLDESACLVRPSQLSGFCSLQLSGPQYQRPYKCQH